MALPIIGISCELKPPEAQRSFSKKKDVLVLNRDYAQAVERAGGLPVLIAILDDRELLTEQIGHLDGLILTGGDDVIAPGREGQSRRVCVQRSQHETALLRAALAEELPILGICRGLQQINVFFGGTLWDDLPAWKPGAVDHRQGKKNGAFRHKITLASESRLATAIGSKSLEVNSYHHQAALGIGEGLHAVAHAEDGVIEALEGTDNAMVWAVQWHPERLGEHPAGSGLLARFVQICKDWKVSG